MPKIGPRLLTAHLSTKSLLSNPARRSGQPSLYQATLRGGTADQVSTKQPYEAERSTKSLSSNHARRSGRSILCRATRRGEGLDLVLLTHVSHDKTRLHLTTFGLQAHISKGRREVTISTTVRHHVQSQVNLHSPLPCGVNQP